MEGTTAENVEKSPAGTSKNAPYQSRNIDFNLRNLEDPLWLGLTRKILKIDIRELSISSIKNLKTTFRFVSRNWLKFLTFS